MAMHGFGGYVGRVLGRLGQLKSIDTQSKPLKVKKQPRPPCKLTDEQVIEARTLHEQQGWTIPQIADKYKLRLQYVRAMLNYEVRSKLIPKQ